MTHSNNWDNRIAEVPSELFAIAEPLLESGPIRRLHSITFLGILSPRFLRKIESPLRNDLPTPMQSDGSRLDHSLEVAKLTLNLVQALDFSSSGQALAVAWAMLHDVASPPLSHTGEAAFATPKETASQLRRNMILGENVPERWSLAPLLNRMNINPEEFASLFSRDGSLAKTESRLLRDIIRSPLTPDTLEGMNRSGKVFDIEVPEPQTILEGLIRTGDEIFLNATHYPLTCDFWQAKSQIYEAYINRDDVIQWESNWAVALRAVHPEMTLLESFESDEDELVDEVISYGLSNVSRAVVRYKPPQRYAIRRPEINSSASLLPDLWRIFQREPIGS